MKKILLFGLTLFSGYLTMAQQVGNVITNTKKDSYDLSTKSKPTAPRHTLDKTRATSRWVNVVDALDDASGGAIYNDFNNTVASGLIWRDSTMLALYNNGTALVQDNIWIKAVSQVLDPVAPAFNTQSYAPGQNGFERGKSYTVDSFAVIGIYERNPAKAAVVDTLILSFANSAEIFSWKESQSAVVGNFATDTIYVADPAWNFTTNTIDGATVITRKIPLTVASLADTIPGGWAYFKVPVGLTVAATGANVCAASVFFKSGDTWTPNVDSVGSATTIYNQFRFVSFEEAANTFRTYQKGDYNNSGLLRNDTTGWGDLFIPSFYFTSATFGYEHHWFDWKLTCSTCNTPVGVSNTEFVLGNVNAYPNPATTQVNFNFTLKAAAKNVSLELTNAVGQVVKTIDLGSKVGNAAINASIPVSDLANGMYIYTLNADGKKISNKLIIK